MSEADRLDLLAYDLSRQRAIADLLDTLAARGLLTPEALASLTLARL